MRLQDCINRHRCQIDDKIIMSYLRLIFPIVADIIDLDIQ